MATQDTGASGADDDSRDNHADPRDDCFSVRLRGAAAGMRKASAAEGETLPMSPLWCSMSEEDATVTVEMNAKVSLANAINGAHTSSGYPSCITANGATSTVYGAFLEFRNPFLHSVTLPPDETIVLAAAATATGTTSSSYSTCQSDTFACRSNASAEASSCNNNTTDGAGSRDPVVRVLWRRMFRLLDSQAAAQFVSPVVVPHHRCPKSPPGFVLPRSAAKSAVYHLQQYPDGIHKVQTSPRLNELLWGLPHVNCTSNSSSSTGAKNNASSGDPNNAAERRSTPTIATNTKSGTGVSGGGDGGNSGNGEESLNHAEKGVEPPEESPVGDAPVQLTLLAANSFNHFTLHIIRHQEDRVLAVVPLQTLTASISTRRITAGCVFLLCVDVTNKFAESGSLSVPHGAARATAEKTRLACCSTEVVAPAISTTAGGRGAATAQSNWMDRLQFEGVSMGAAKGVGDVMEVVTVHIAVEPYVLLGNQSGDIFLFSIFEGKVIQRLNYSGGLLAGVTAETAEPSRRQIVSSSVSCIVEVECGIEKHLEMVIDRACRSKRRGEHSFIMPNPSAANGLLSTFAVGFDNGHVLLVCVTAEGAWVKRHLSSFGPRSVEAISMRVPHFFARLWATNHSCYRTTSVARGAKKNESQAEAKEREEEETEEEQQHQQPSCCWCTSLRVVFTPVEALVADENNAIAAISCDGGALRLVRTPELEVEVCRIYALNSNAVGNFLALQWLPSSADAALRPDLLVATSEDDTMTVYQLLPRSTPGACQTPKKVFLSSASETPTLGLREHGGSDDRPPVQGDLVFVARRLFHRSWVVSLCALPLPSGHLLIATSYDSQSSFWPFHYGAVAPILCVDRLPSSLSFEPFLQKCFSGLFIQDLDVAPLLGPSVLPVDPAASISLHKDLTVRCMTAGAGSSRFVVSLCLRGRVKIWEVKLVTD